MFEGLSLSLICKREAGAVVTHNIISVAYCCRAAHECWCQAYSALIKTVSQLLCHFGCYKGQNQTHFQLACMYCTDVVTHFQRHCQSKQNCLTK